MKKSLLILFMVIISTIMIISCSKDDNTETKYETLVNYMNNNGMTFGDLFANWIVTADSLHNAMGMYDILDLRGADKNDNGIVDFEEGHIEGAVLTSLGGILDAAAVTTKPVIVVCYTGQTAGHAVMALRLSGYMDARVLKWGMSGWNGDFDKWTPNVHQLDHENWVVAPGSIVASEEFDMPGFSSGSSDGEDILKDRVTYMLENGFQGISAVNDESTGVLDMPENYFINNFWDAENVVANGNITGAYRIKPLNLDNLDPDEIIVTYCWTGQTSSMLTAYLTVLGYNAKSLSFGANGIIYNTLQDHKWSASADFDYVTGP